MSGITDTSTPADRQRFDNAIAHGGGVTIRPAALAVANCQARLPEATSGLLGMREGATYAQAVAQLRTRWADGRAGH